MRTILTVFAVLLAVTASATLAYNNSMINFTATSVADSRWQACQEARDNARTSVSKGSDWNMPTYSGCTCTEQIVQAQYRWELDTKQYICKVTASATKKFEAQRRTYGWPQ